MKNKNLNIELFYVFCKIGIGTIGGGFAMIPMMQQEIVDKKKWLTEDEFYDILAASQSMPGVFAANMAGHIGYKLGGVFSSVVSVIGNIIPSIISILLIAMIFGEIRDNVFIENAFKAIRPAVVALIAVPVFKMIKNNRLDLWKILLVVFIVMVLYLFDKISPIYFILLAILFAVIKVLFLSFNKKNKLR